MKLAAEALTRARLGANNGSLVFAAGLLLAAIGVLRSGKRRVISALTPIALGLVFASCGGGNGNGGGEPPGTGAHDAGLDAAAATPDGSSGEDSGQPQPDAGNEACSDAGPPATVGLFYAHTDHLGTPQFVTDGNQNVVWSTTYQPYGTMVATSGSITQNLRLPGQYADS
jgi:uncharacterized protein RhaS with RHS repeats